MQCSKKAALFDHLVGAGEQHGRRNKSERLGSFQIDDRFEFGRLLNWQVGRLLALEYSVDEIRRTAPILAQVNAVAR
jgi:hypothetical protein